VTRPADSRVPRSLLLDVEGTTTSIRFVHEVLFPFARAGVGAYLAGGGGEAAAERIEELRSEWAAERLHESEDAPPGWDTTRPAVSATTYAVWLMDRDRKSTALKALQGDIWRTGYESGELRGEVFDDVAPAFRRWKASGKAIRIFSSGSVQAQALLFRYSSSGDLTGYLDGYFDTTTGPKTEPRSYRRILAVAGVAPEETLFLSDSMRELDAARIAGLRVALSVRPGNAPVSPGPEEWLVGSFDLIT
jgi:enolase-phosphatase E1